MLELSKNNRFRCLYKTFSHYVLNHSKVEEVLKSECWVTIKVSVEFFCEQKDESHFRSDRSKSKAWELMTIKFDPDYDCFYDKEYHVKNYGDELKKPLRVKKNDTLSLNKIEFLARYARYIYSNPHISVTRTRLEFKAFTSEKCLFVINFCDSVETDELSKITIVDKFNMLAY